jgi:eukaryotic-like serine/threonine-protein kinase
MNHPPTETGDHATAVEAKRFTYPGGSRPLDGFTIKRGIGHGGFGEVYYATSDAGKEVALKLIRRSLDVELRGIKQCLNLKHPNLLGVFDIKEDSRGDHWVVMEYVAGDCLDDVIARNPNGMPTHEALAWFAGIAAGVGYLHDHGIVHRDLKPGNIFSENGKVSIGDYGLSKFISCSRRSGHTESVGTVHYMAPEVANGRYGKEIDIYALGIILYEMLTGRLPFEGESVGEVLMKHLTAKPDVSMLDEPYRSVIAKALEKDPDQRFSSVDEMAARLPIDHRSAVLPQARVTRPAPAGSNGSAKPGTAGVLGGTGVSPVENATTGPAGCPFVPPVAGRADEEPILRGVRDVVRSFREWRRDLNPGAQAALMVVIVLVAFGTAQFWLPLAMLALILYGIYRVIRAIVLAGSGTPATRRPATPVGSAGVSGEDVGATGVSPVVPNGTPAASATSATPNVPRKHYRRFRHHEEAVRAMIVKPVYERLVDLLGSLLLAALVATITTLVTATVVTVLCADVLPVDSYFHPEVFAYMLLVSIAGAWAVLIPSKSWEGTEGDPLVRRFVMMTLGIVLGGVAWGFMQLLTVAAGQLEGFPEYHLAMFRYSSAHGPFPLLTCLVAFGTLMLLARWWRQADPLRPARLSLWSMAASMIAAILVAAVWQTHGWALVTIAGIMSVSIQIASPWVNPRLRHAGPEE